MMSLRQFCAITGLSYQMACKFAAQGRLNCVKVSGAYRISMIELRRFQSEGLLPPPEKIKQVTNQ